MNRSSSAVGGSSRPKSSCLVCASFGRSNLENADSARRCRFRNSQQKRASDLDAIYVCIPKLHLSSRDLRKFLIEARHVSPQTASLLVGMEPLFSLIGMPIFGILADRYAHRSLLMMVGSLFIVPVFPMLSYASIPA